MKQGSGTAYKGLLLLSSLAAAAAASTHSKESGVYTGLILATAYIYKRQYEKAKNFWKNMISFLRKCGRLDVGIIYTNSVPKPPLNRESQTTPLLISTNDVGIIYTNSVAHTTIFIPLRGFYFMPALHRVGGRIKRAGERIISPLEKVQRKLITKRERSRIVKEWAKTLISGELSEEQLREFSKLNKEFRLASVLEALKRAKNDEIDNLAKNLVNFTKHPELRSTIGEGYIQAKKELEKAIDDNFWPIFALMLSIYSFPLLPTSPPHSVSTVRKVAIGYEAYNISALAAYFLTLLRMRGKKKVAEKYRRLLKRYKELYQQVNR